MRKVSPLPSVVAEAAGATLAFAISTDCGKTENDATTIVARTAATPVAERKFFRGDLHRGAQFREDAVLDKWITSSR